MKTDLNCELQNVLLILWVTLLWHCKDSLLQAPFSWQRRVIDVIAGSKYPVLHVYTTTSLYSIPLPSLLAWARSSGCPQEMARIMICVYYKYQTSYNRNFGINKRKPTEWYNKALHLYTCSLDIDFFNKSPTSLKACTVEKYITTNV